MSIEYSAQQGDSSVYLEDDVGNISYVRCSKLE